MDRIKIIATLKWVHDILRELRFADVLDDIDDCIMMLKKEQRGAVQHQWVGLTEHEIWECQKPGLSDDVYKLIEAKLRERNT